MARPLHIAAEAPAALPVGRRAAARVRLDLPAELLVLDGLRRGRLKNLSRTGASIELSPPPRTASQGFLRFAGLELFVQVMWSGGGRSGLLFDKPISDDTLFAMRQLAEQIPLLERSQQEDAIRDWVNGRSRILAGRA